MDPITEPPQECARIVLEVMTLEVGNPGPKFHTPLAEREEAACGDVQLGINPIMTKHNLHRTEDVPA